MLSTVLLPEPDGPSSATNSPRRTSKDTSRTASIVVFANWNDLLRPLTSTRRSAEARGDRVALVSSALNPDRPFVPRR